MFDIVSVGAEPQLPAVVGSEIVEILKIAFPAVVRESETAYDKLDQPAHPVAEIYPAKYLPPSITFAMKPSTENVLVPAV